MDRRVRPEEVVKTVEQLSRRVEERFPGSGLLDVVRELLAIAREAAQRAEANQRPLLWVRGIVALLIAGIVAAIVEIPLQFGRLGRMDTVSELIQVLEPTIGIAFFLTAFIVFLLSLETRIKRQRTLTALHELRAMAHVVDMHQLTKDPTSLVQGWVRTASSPERTLSQFELGRYLDYSSEILALISKLAAIYVQGFPDSEAVGAVDEVENLTTGLSRKIWQKLMMLQAEGRPLVTPPAGLASQLR